MICPKCGHKNDEDADFCENCGTKLKTPTQINQVQMEQQIKGI